MKYDENQNNRKLEALPGFGTNVCDNMPLCCTLHIKSLILTSLNMKNHVKVIGIFCPKLMEGLELFLSRYHRVIENSSITEGSKRKNNNNWNLSTSKEPLLIKEKTNMGKNLQAAIVVLLNILNILRENCWFVGSCDCVSDFL